MARIVRRLSSDIAFISRLVAKFPTQDFSATLINTTIPASARNLIQRLQFHAQNPTAAITSTKLVLCGHQRGGKSTLLKALANPKEEQVSTPADAITLGISIPTDLPPLHFNFFRLPVLTRFYWFEKKVAWTSAWDLAGQAEFHSFHSLLLAQRDSVVLLLVDLRDEAAICEQRIEHWLHLLYASHNLFALGAESRFKVPIVLVGTHTDELASDDVRRDRQTWLEHAAARYAEAWLKTSLNVLRDCHAVNCTDPRSRAMDALRTALGSHLQRVVQNEKVTTTLEQLQKVVLPAMRKKADLKQFPVVLLRDVLAHVAKSDDVDVQRVLLPTLKIDLRELHALGEVVFVERGGADALDATILLNVAWLSDCVIPVLFSDVTRANSLIPTSEPSLATTGASNLPKPILLWSAVKDSLADKHKITLDEHSEPRLLELLAHLDICYPLDSNNCRVLVPAKLRVRLTAEDARKLNLAENPHGVVIVGRRLIATAPKFCSFATVFSKLQVRLHGLLDERFGSDHATSIQQPRHFMVAGWQSFWWKTPTEQPIVGYVELPASDPAQANIVLQAPTSARDAMLELLEAVMVEVTNTLGEAALSDPNAAQAVGPAHAVLALDPKHLLASPLIAASGAGAAVLDDNTSATGWGCGYPLEELPMPVFERDDTRQLITAKPATTAPPGVHVVACVSDSDESQLFINTGLMKDPRCIKFSDLYNENGSVIWPYLHACCVPSQAWPPPDDASIPGILPSQVAVYEIGPPTHVRVDVTVSPPGGQFFGPAVFTVSAMPLSVPLEYALVPLATAADTAAGVDWQPLEVHKPYWVLESSTLRLRVADSSTILLSVPFDVQPATHLRTLPVTANPPGGFQPGPIDVSLESNNPDLLLEYQLGDPGVPPSALPPDGWKRYGQLPVRVEATAYLWVRTTSADGEPTHDPPSLFPFVIGADLRVYPPGGTFVGTTQVHLSCPSNAATDIDYALSPSMDEVPDVWARYRPIADAFPGPIAVSSSAVLFIRVGGERGSIEKVPYVINDPLQSDLLSKLREMECKASAERRALASLLETQLDDLESEASAERRALASLLETQLDDLEKKLLDNVSSLRAASSRTFALVRNLAQNELPTSICVLPDLDVGWRQKITTVLLRSMRLHLLCQPAAGTPHFALNHRGYAFNMQSALMVKMAPLARATIALIGVAAGVAKRLAGVDPSLVPSLAVSLIETMKDDGDVGQLMSKLREFSAHLEPHAAEPDAGEALVDGTDATSAAAKQRNEEEKAALHTFLVMRGAMEQVLWGRIGVLFRDIDDATGNTRFCCLEHHSNGRGSSPVASIALRWEVARGERGQDDVLSVWLDGVLDLADVSPVPKKAHVKVYFRHFHTSNRCTGEGERRVRKEPGVEFTPSPGTPASFTAKEAKRQRLQFADLDQLAANASLLFVRVKLADDRELHGTTRCVEGGVQLATVELYEPWLGNARCNDQSE